MIFRQKARLFVEKTSHRNDVLSPKALFTVLGDRRRPNLEEDSV